MNGRCRWSIEQMSTDYRSREFGPVFIYRKCQRWFVYLGSRKLQSEFGGYAYLNPCPNAISFTELRRVTNEVSEVMNVSCLQTKARLKSLNSCPSPPNSNMDVCLQNTKIDKRSKRFLLWKQYFKYYIYPHAVHNLKNSHESSLNVESLLGARSDDARFHIVIRFY